MCHPPKHGGLPEIARAMKTGDFVNPDAHDPKEVFEKWPLGCFDD